MDSVDASDHYSKKAVESTAALLTIVIDTSPLAWAALNPTLPLARATAALLIFVNAHLAFNHANRVAVVAAHPLRAEFLYPPGPALASSASISASENGGSAVENGDVEMTDAPASSSAAAAATSPTDQAGTSYRPFAVVAAALSASLARLVATTRSSGLSGTNHAEQQQHRSRSTQQPSASALAGALTLALTHANKVSLAVSEAGAAGAAGQQQQAQLGTGVGSSGSISAANPLLSSRILVLSVSPPSPAHYIPLMNTTFAAARLGVPIDVLAIPPPIFTATSSSASPTAPPPPSSLSNPFLQQAASTTLGVYLSLPPNSARPKPLLQTLLQAFLPHPPSRAFLIPPAAGAGTGAAAGVDFRAACFCHRRVVDLGFVCSVCLSIFCEPPEGAICLTCGTHLRVPEDYGARPVVVAAPASGAGAADAGARAGPAGGLPGTGKSKKREKDARRRARDLGGDRSHASTPVPA